MDSCSLVWLMNGMRTNPTHQMDVRKLGYGKEPALPDALHKTFFFLNTLLMLHLRFFLAWVV